MGDEATDRDRMVRLPRTSRRQERLAWVKVLRSVDLEADTGFGFEGVILRSGALIAESVLTAQSPGAPVLLEYAGAAGRGRGTGSLYVLWRYNLESRTWTEIARAVGMSWEWAITLRSIAFAALAEAPRIEERPNIKKFASDIGRVLDEALETLTPADRALAVSVLHDRFAGEMARRK